MAEPNSKPTTPKANQDTSRPFSGFMYKVILVSVIIALLPIFPSSQSPELSTKSILARSWELLHLLLVGIAISYGVFSRRNSDPDIEKETQLKADTPQSYVSQILQVSPVFDDEETHSPKPLGDLADEPKNQTWNYSQYYREEPVVMVKESAEGTNSSTKPLFLPVRSLKSRPQYYDEIFNDEPSFMSNTTDEAEKTVKVGGKESVVLPSPIPWRSRSGRMEVKEEYSSSPPCSPLTSPFGMDPGISTTPSFRSHTPRESTRTPSPKRVSPPPSFSPEMRGKINEDFGRRRSFSKPSPPPPPPPPPPPFNHASYFMSEKRNSRQSLKDELEHLGSTVRGERDGFLPSNSEDASTVRRSVRTVRMKEVQNRPPLPRKQRAKRNEFREKMIINSDSESDGDHADSGLSESDAGEASNSVSREEAVTEENEVDKKADEFIAKFREQIRLQRIASIKRSTGQRSARSSN